MADATNYTPRGFIEVPVEIILATEKPGMDWKRIFFITLGIALFLGIYYMPPWPAAVDPTGKAFELSPQGKGAIALFLLAG